MLEKIPFFVLAGAVAMAGCIAIDTTDAGTDVGDDTTGDGDGDPTGDGDGDPTGDGDGDPAGDGDGDGDPTGDGDGDGDPTGDGDGDGDGDPTGDGDGEPAGMCGWNPDGPYYDCGFEGADPGGTFPLECPDGLLEGDPCSNTGLTGEGCCDANGDNWYCAEGEVVFFNACS